MTRQLDDDQFCTVVCACLRQADGAGFEFTVAGTLHRSCSAPAAPSRRLRLPDPELGDRTVILGAGDAAVFYTDGIVEARGPDGSFFGEERLRTLLRTFVGLEAPAIAGKLRDVILEYGEGNPSDDVAVLVLRAPE